MPNETYARALLPTDTRPSSETAYLHAVRLALMGQGSVDLVHVHLPGEAPAPMKLPSMRELVVRWGLLDPAAEVHSFRRLSAHLRVHNLHSLDLLEPVLDVAASQAPDLLVLPTEARRSLERLQVASAAEALARRLPLPALFVPHDTRPFVDRDTGAVLLRRVLVPAGGMADTRTALDAAMRLVRSYHAGPTEFVVVHVGDRSSVPALLLPRDDPRWSWRLDVRSGAVPQEIVRAAHAHDVDAIVMATHGHDSLGDWLVGSRTEIVARHAPCPVLAVPA